MKLCQKSFPINPEFDYKDLNIMLAKQVTEQEEFIVGLNEHIDRLEYEYECLRMMQEKR